MLQLGDKKISELYLGEKKVSEVYLGEKKIRPIGPWEYTPTDWDFIYAPFRKDFKNYAWVGKPGHIDITPIQWVDIKFWAAYFNGDGMAEIWNQSRWSWKKIKTYSFRCKYLNENFIVFSQKTWDVYMFQIKSDKTASNNGKGNNRDSLLDSSKSINKFKWNHFVLTQTNVHPNIVKMYLNWEKYEEKTLWSFDRAPEVLWRFYWYSSYKLNWFVSDLIISWDYWDDDKVKRYYEKSKSRYQYIDIQYPDDIIRAEFQHRTVWLWTGTYQNRTSSEKWYSFTSKSLYDKTAGNGWVFCTYWIKPATVDSNDFLSVWSIAKGYSWYLMWHHTWLATKKNVIQLYDWAIWRDVPVNLPVNQWSNLAYWYENWKFKVYVNGNLIHTENTNASFRSDYEPAITYWQCEMAGFHILRSPLTETQVKEHYDKTKDRFELNHIGELLYLDNSPGIWKYIVNDHTKAYRPLNWDVKDYSWNNYNWTQNNVTLNFSQWHYSWIYWAHFSRVPSWIDYGNVLWSTFTWPFTLHMYVRTMDYVDHYWFISKWLTNMPYPFDCYVLQGDWRLCFFLWDWTSYLSVTTTTGLSAMEWVLVTLTYDWSKSTNWMKVYFNWVRKGTIPSTYWTPNVADSTWELRMWYRKDGNNALQWTMSEVILEDIVWDDEDIMKYYKMTSKLIYKKTEEMVFDWTNHSDTNAYIPQGSFTVSLEFKTTHDYRWANNTWWTILGKYYWPSTREAFILWISCREREGNKLGIWMRDLWAVQCWGYIESKQVNDWQWHKAVVARDSVSKQFVFNVDWVNYDTETINYWNFWPNSLGIWAIKDNWSYKNYFRWSMKNITITKEFRPTWYF